MVLSFSFVFFSTISTIVAVYLWKKWQTFNRMRIMVNKLPGPPALPIFGNILSLKFDKREFMRQARGFTVEFGHHGAVKIWMGPVPMIFLTTGEACETIITSNTLLEKSSNYNFLEKWIGNGLLISTGDKWRQRRKLLTPTFHFAILNGFIHVFNEQADILVGELMKAVTHGDNIVDIFPFIGRCALDIICETAMGVQISAQRNHKSEYVLAVKRISEIIMDYERKLWLWFKPIFHLLGHAKQFESNKKILKSFTMKVIRDRMEERKNEAGRKAGPTDTKRREAFLDLLLSMQGDDLLPFEGIVEEVDTFMFEGHDTTSSGMTWAVFMLGHHMDVQQKAYDEMMSIFGDSTRPPTAEDLREMKYLDCVIKETLRLYPPVGWFARHAKEDFAAGPYIIPKGSNVNISPLYIHRDKKMYGEDADEFRPERFETDALAGRHPYAYIPFSAGPRNCIGQKFALMEEKAVLSMLIRHFEIRSVESVEDVDAVDDLILRPYDKLLVQLKPRLA